MEQQGPSRNPSLIFITTTTATSTTAHVLRTVHFDNLEQTLLLKTGQLSKFLPV